MVIRRLSDTDASTLQACRLFGLQESPEAFLVSLAEVEQTSLATVEAELRDPDIHYVGAFDDGELVGFMRYVRPTRSARRHTAEVRSVYVKKAVRGHHVGSRLLHQLITDACEAGLETLTLSVLADNGPAKRLYESCGFRQHGTEPRAVMKGDRYIDQDHYWRPLA